MNIMFVCTGNICRSAIAHKMLEKEIKDKKIKNLKVYSSGIFAENGDKSPEFAIEELKKYNIDLSKHRALNIYDANIENMDLILCATIIHKEKIKTLFPKIIKNVYTIKEYVGLIDFNLKDPWGGNKKNLKSVLKI
jgi:protein-tyrosine-phosphatase